jgi:sugar (pentulose or hexulose) kinase
MTVIRHVAVVDIGKTNAKVALVDLDAMAEIAVCKTPNRPAAGGLYPHHDVGAIWSFILGSLAELGRELKVDAIAVTTHGATAALLGPSGRLALPVLDYEHDGPSTVRNEYDAVRPDFAETGSPPLPLGLNLGAQLFWQSRAFPDRFAEVSSILMYPQYWAWKLCGVASNEVTSLGCHTDLWNPRSGGFSSLTDRMGWRSLFAPVRPATAALAPIRPELATEIGLDPSTPVFCGIHDSNASLLPHLLSRRPPFTVVSTGTWVVAMAVGGAKVSLDPKRDTLMNVSAMGAPVPSARFMGGREYEALTAGQEGNWTDGDINAVLANSVMLLPSVQQGSGPFPRTVSRWVGSGEPAAAERAVAAAFYLAMMTATCLELVGAEGETVVEGPFARNVLYVDMLRAATGRPVLPQHGQAGTSIGAALLAGKPVTRPPETSVSPTQYDARWGSYAAKWRELTRDV